MTVERVTNQKPKRASDRGGKYAAIGRPLPALEPRTAVQSWTCDSEELDV